MKKRITHIDIAKGISISLVALFHNKLSASIPQIIDPMSLFRMPLFFFLSGVFFSYSSPPKTFVLKKFDALLKPYFFVLLSLFLIGYLSADNLTSSDLIGIFYGNGDTIHWQWTPMWFLTHLFALYVFSYCLFYFFKFAQLTNELKWLVLFSFMVIGSLFIDTFWAITDETVTKPGLPFSIDIILVSSTYFILGHQLRDKVINLNPNLLKVSVAIAVFMAITAFTDAHTDLNRRVYDNPVFATIGALAGIYLILSFSWLLSKLSWLSYIPLQMGAASLFILIFHCFIGGKTDEFLSHDISNETALFLIAIFTYFLSIFVPVLIKKLVEKSQILSLAFFPLITNPILHKTGLVHR